MQTLRGYYRLTLHLSSDLNTKCQDVEGILMLNISLDFTL
jgi:hypothetical protein